MRLDIAGLTIEYRSAPDLNEKVRKELVTTQSRRKTLNEESNELRKREKTLQRFLGGASASGEEIGGGGSHV